MDVLNPGGPQRADPALAPADLFAPLAPLPFPAPLFGPNPGRQTFDPSSEPWPNSPLRGVAAQVQRPRFPSSKRAGGHPLGCDCLPTVSFTEAEGAPPSEGAVREGHAPAGGPAHPEPSLEPKVSQRSRTGRDALLPGQDHGPRPCAVCFPGVPGTHSAAPRVAWHGVACPGGLTEVRTARRGGLAFTVIVQGPEPGPQGPSPGSPLTPSVRFGESLLQASVSCSEKWDKDNTRSQAPGRCEVGQDGDVRVHVQWALASLL